MARIALVGSPNSGKSSVFNGLTGFNAKTGNRDDGVEGSEVRAGGGSTSGSIDRRGDHRRRHRGGNRRRYRRMGVPRRLVLSRIQVTPLRSFVCYRKACQHELRSRTASRDSRIQVSVAFNAP
ncbi:FeoB small GTPase domain-containing protein [Streptomyces sp. NPDC054783]